MKITCPSCGFHNIEGTDRCEECLHSLMQRDLPYPRKDDNFQRVMMTAPVLELLTGRDLLVASPQDSVEKIVKILTTKNKSCVLIYDKKKLVGIVSERKLLMEAAGKDKDLSKMKARDIMTPDPECIQADAPIAYAVNKMSLGGFRHVPVLAADGTPVSILSSKDVLHYLMRRDKNPASSNA